MARAEVVAALLALTATLSACTAAPPAAPGIALGFSPGNMDTTVDPRQDFYRYATGRWLDGTEIPASEADVGGFSKVLQNIDAQLLTIVEKAAATPAAAGTPQQQIGDYYRAAMDLKRLDEIGLRPLQADLKLLDDIAGPARLGTLAARLQLGYIVSPLINADVGPDFKDSTTNVLAIGPGEQALEQDEYTTPEGQRVRDLYLAFITRMHEALGDTPAAAAAAARTVLSIETELAAAKLTPLQGRDPAKLYNKVTLEQAQALIPAIDLKAFLGALDVTPPATLQVPDVGGLQALQKVLATRPAADVRTLLRWHIVSARAGTLGQPWRGLDEQFTMQRKGLTSAPPRAREITQLIGAQLYHPLSQLYVQAYFADSTRRDVVRMVGLVKDEFAMRLRSNAWLDEPTRAAALDKLARVDIQVGYPKDWIDFSSVAIRPDDHFGNAQRLSAFVTRRQLARVGRPVVQERFAEPTKTTPISVNAAYNPLSNSIDISAAILQPPFYKPGADAAVNYCTVGAVIGHELTHGFDSFGRQFGPAGNLRDWWTPKATAEFKQRTDVLVEQYSAFTILPGLQHNGTLTLTENTADLGGITLAHAALQRALASQPQPPIDGLSADQRCFIAWAQMWAYKGRPERLRLLANIDYHANSSLRGFAPLLHLDAFHQAFGTRPGDAMWRDPARRVRIW